MYSIWNPSLPSYTNQLFLSILSYFPKKYLFTLLLHTIVLVLPTTHYTPHFLYTYFFLLLYFYFQLLHYCIFFVFVLHTFCIIFFLSFMNKRTVFSLLFLFFIWYFFSFILVIIVLSYISIFFIFLAESRKSQALWPSGKVQRYFSSFLF